MNCADIDNQMDAMVDGGLDQQAERKFVAHLAGCPTCQSKWEQLQGLRPLLQRVAVSAPSASLEGRVMSAFYKRHAARTSVGANWRALLSGRSFSRPAFTMIMAAVIVAAVTGAFVLGRVTAPQIVVPAPPALTASLPGLPPSTPPESRVERQLSAEFRPGAERHRTRHPVRRTAAGKSGVRTPTANPIESFATVSPSGTSYSTKASLAGFEPLRDTKVRVVKGEEQR